MGKKKRKALYIKTLTYGIKVLKLMRDSIKRDDFAAKERK